MGGDMDANTDLINRHLAAREAHDLATATWDMECPECGWTGEQVADTHRDAPSYPERYCPNCDCELTDV